MNHSAHTSQWCRSSKLVMSRIFSNAAWEEVCHTCEWVVSLAWMSRVTNVNEPCHINGRGMSHTCTSNVTHVKAQRGKCHMAIICVSDIHHDMQCHSDDSWSAIVMTMAHEVPYDDSCHDVCLTHVCHVSCMNESCHTIEWCVSCVWMNAVTHINAQCGKRHVTRMDEWYHTNEWVMPCTWMGHATRMNDPCHTNEYGMSRI